MNPVAPTRVIGGRYVVLGELGRGGMGTVWRAEDRVMGRHVAVKELHLPTGLSPDERRLFRERLLREARTAGRLSDPGIVTVHDVVSDGGVDHIVMELIDAPTLADVVATRGPLDERGALGVAQQLVSALRVAHDSGVVHRDVKPSNVMLRSDGRVKLTDFGIAQAADDPRLTTTGSIIGSPAYLAPERLAGGEASPATDMWAVGATLYLAVTGTAPFAKDTTAATIAAVLHADVVAPRTRSTLGPVVGGLLQRSPQARLTGAQAAALLASEQTVPLRSVGAGTATSPLPARRGRVVGWALAALVVGLVAGLVGGYLVGRGSGGPDTIAFTYGDGGQIPVFALTSPTCVLGRLAAGRTVDTGASVSCERPHDAEVFAASVPFSTSRVLPYPGVEQLTSYGRAACDAVFSSAVVGGADKASLQQVVLVPAEAAFEAESSTGGSYPARDIVCALQSRDGGQLTDARLTPS